MNSFDLQLTALMPELKKFAFNLAKNNHDANDLLQDTLERALTKKHQYQAGTNFKGWVFTIMYTRFLGNKRKEKVRNRVYSGTSVDEIEYLAPTPPNQLDHMVLEDLKRVWNMLPQKYRQILLLINIEGYSYKKAARTLGWPIGTVMTRLHRARERLRELLDPSESVFA